MKIAYERASRCAVTGFTGKYVGLTRIRLHVGVYFLLHRKKFAGKHCKWARLSRRLGLNVEFHYRMNLPNSVVRHVLATVALIFWCMAYVPERFANHCAQGASENGHKSGDYQCEGGQNNGTSHRKPTRQNGRVRGALFEMLSINVGHG